MHLNSPKIGASNPARPNKIVSAAEAVRLIHDGDTVATGGFVGIGFAEGIAIALEDRFFATQAETSPPAIVVFGTQSSAFSLATGSPLIVADQGNEESGVG